MIFQLIIIESRVYLELKEKSGKYWGKYLRLSP